MTEKKYVWKIKFVTKKTPFLFFSTEGGRWRNFSLTFLESSDRTRMNMNKDKIIYFPKGRTLQKYSLLTQPQKFKGQS